MSGLIEDNWILPSTSTFNLLQHIVLVEVYEENFLSHRNVIRKEKENLIAFQLIVNLLRYSINT